MWTGGRPVLGYDFAGCRLVVNEPEAALVRRVFVRYLDHKSLSRLAAELNADGATVKRWTTKAGVVVGGGEFHKSHLYRLLSNPLYIGKVPHHGTLHQGAHAAIVDEVLFARVQQLLVSNGRAGGTFTRNTYGGLLKGILVCGECNAPMTHSCSLTKAGVRHRYYVCRAQQLQGKRACGMRPLPADRIEQFVIDKVKPGLGRPELITLVFDTARNRHDEQSRDLAARIATHERELWACEQVLTRGPDAGATFRHARAAADLASDAAAMKQLSAPQRHDVERALQEFDGLWAELSPSEKAGILRAVVERVTLREGGITIALRERDEEAA